MHSQVFSSIHVLMASCVPFASSGYPCIVRYFEFVFLFLQKNSLNLLSLFFAHEMSEMPQFHWWVTVWCTIHFGTQCLVLMTLMLCMVCNFTKLVTSVTTLVFVYVFIYLNAKQTSEWEWVRNKEKLRRVQTWSTQSRHHHQRHRISVCNHQYRHNCN